MTTLTYQGYKVTISLSDGKTIFVKLVDQISFAGYEASLERKDFGLQYDITTIYELLQFAFEGKDVNYKINIVVLSGFLKLEFHFRVGGLIKIDFDVVLKEKAADTNAVKHIQKQDVLLKEMEARIAELLKNQERLEERLKELSNAQSLEERINEVARRLEEQVGDLLHKQQIVEDTITEKVKQYFSDEFLGKIEASVDVQDKLQAHEAIIEKLLVVVNDKLQSHEAMMENLSFAEVNIGHLSKGGGPFGGPGIYNVAIGTKELDVTDGCNYICGLKLKSLFRLRKFSYWGPLETLKSDSLEELVLLNMLGNVDYVYKWDIIKNLPNLRTIRAPVSPDWSSRLEGLKQYLHALNVELVIT